METTGDSDQGRMGAIFQTFQLLVVTQCSNLQRESLFSKNSVSRMTRIGGPTQYNTVNFGSTPLSFHISIEYLSFSKYRQNVPKHTKRFTV